MLHCRGDPKKLQEFVNQSLYFKVTGENFKSSSITPRDDLRGSSPPELPRDRRRAGEGRGREPRPVSSRPLRGARLPSGDGKGPNAEISP